MFINPFDVYKPVPKNYEQEDISMKTKTIATFVQKKLVHAVPEKIHRSRPMPSSSAHGECWPQSDGRQKTTMWQSPSWPAPGKNLPRAAKGVISSFKNI
jgi:hypothetical protein